MNDEAYKHALLKIGYWAAIGLIVFAFFRYVFAYTIPFLIALAVAAALQPAIRFLSKKLKIKKGIVAIVLVTLACLLLAGVALLIFVRIITGVTDLVMALPSGFTNNIAPVLTEYGEKLEVLFSRIDEKFVGIINNAIPNIVSSLGKTVTDFSVSVVSYASGVAVSVPGALLTMIICVIATMFMTVDYEKVVTYFQARMPKKSVSILSASVTGLKGILLKYIRSYFLIMLITFAEVGAGLLIIGINNALLIALIVAVFDILPVVGSGMILLPWAIITLIQGNLGRGIGLAILYVIVITARQIYEPRIVGRSVGLHPLVTLFCMWVGVKTLGVVGMFGFPVAILLVKYLRAAGLIQKEKLTQEL